MLASGVVSSVVVAGPSRLARHRTTYPRLPQPWVVSRSAAPVWAPCWHRRGFATEGSFEEAYEERKRVDPLGAEQYRRMRKLELERRAKDPRLDGSTGQVEQIPEGVYIGYIPPYTGSDPPLEYPGFWKSVKYIWPHVRGALFPKTELLRKLPLVVRCKEAFGQYMRWKQVWREVAVMALPLEKDGRTGRSLPSTNLLLDQARETWPMAQRAFAAGDFDSPELKAKVHPSVLRHQSRLRSQIMSALPPYTRLEWDLADEPKMEVVAFNALEPKLNKIVAQVAVRIRSKQTLVAIDESGKVIMGSREEPIETMEYWIWQSKKWESPDYQMFLKVHEHTKPQWMVV